MLNLKIVLIGNQFSLNRLLAFEDDMYPHINFIVESTIQHSIKDYFIDDIAFWLWQGVLTCRNIYDEDIRKLNKITLKIAQGDYLGISSAKQLYRS